MCQGTVYWGDERSPSLGTACVQDISATWGETREEGKANKGHQEIRELSSTEQGEKQGQPFLGVFLGKECYFEMDTQTEENEQLPI